MTVNTGSGILELVLGMSLIYTMLSLLCSTVNEYLAQLFGLRARKLQRWMRYVLSDKGSQAFYDSAVIKSISGAGVGKIKRPSYIPSRSFALALLDLIAPADETAGVPAMATTKELIGKISDSDLLGSPIKGVLTTLVNNAGGNLEKATKDIETWFDSAMDRVSGWYKRQQRWITALLACVVIVVLNADSVRMFGILWHSPEMRAVCVAHAKEVAAVNNEDPKFDVPLPLGWDTKSKNTSTASKLLGWFITFLAVSLGAPFWFDALRRIANIQATGPSPGKPNQQK